MTFKDGKDIYGNNGFCYSMYSEYDGRGFLVKSIDNLGRIRYYDYGNIRDITLAEAFESPYFYLKPNFCQPRYYMWALMKSIKR